MDSSESPAVNRRLAACLQDVGTIFRDQGDKVGAAAMLGQLRSTSIRSLCWKYSLGILPSLEHASAWSETLDAKRAEYQKLKSHWLKDPRKAKEIQEFDPKTFNPLSDAQDNPWVEFFKVKEEEKVIAQDLDRLFPGDDYFLQTNVREKLLCVLQVFSLENPQLGYRQGMHELAAVLLSMLEKESLSKDPDFKPVDALLFRTSHNEDDAESNAEDAEESADSAARGRSRTLFSESEHDPVSPEAAAPASDGQPAPQAEAAAAGVNDVPAAEEEEEEKEEEEKKKKEEEKEEAEAKTVPVAARGRAYEEISWSDDESDEDEEEGLENAEEEEEEEEGVPPPPSSRGHPSSPQSCGAEDAGGLAEADALAADTAGAAAAAAEEETILRRGDVLNLMSCEHLEADTYLLFNRLMTQLEPMFRTEHSNVQRRKDSKIVKKCSYIFNKLLCRADPELYLHLLRLEIEPQVFALRWIRLLFVREFHLEDLYTLWDAIFAFELMESGRLNDEGSSGSSSSDVSNHSFVLVDWITVAMLGFVRNDIMAKGQIQVLRRLMRFPPLEDVIVLVERALVLKRSAEDKDAGKAERGIVNPPVVLETATPSGQPKRKVKSQIKQLFKPLRSSPADADGVTKETNPQHALHLVALSRLQADLGRRLETVTMQLQNEFSEKALSDALYLKISQLKQISRVMQALTPYNQHLPARTDELGAGDANKEYHKVNMAFLAIAKEMSDATALAKAEAKRASELEKENALLKEQIQILKEHVNVSSETTSPRADVDDNNEA